MASKQNICTICDKSPLEKNEFGVCKKMLGDKTEKFFCLPCLAEYLNTTVDDLNAKIEEFKEQGCTLFQ